MNGVCGMKIDEKWTLRNGFFGAILDKMGRIVTFFVIIPSALSTVVRSVLSKTDSGEQQ